MWNKQRPIFFHWCLNSSSPSRQEQSGWEEAKASSGVPRILRGREKASHVFPVAPQCVRSGFNQSYQPSISCTIKLTTEIKRAKENGWKRQPTACNRKAKQAPSFQRAAASLLLFILEMKSSCKRVLSSLKFPVVPSADVWWVWREISE